MSADIAAAESKTIPASTRAAIVTGASTGIGEATVRVLRTKGWTVLAVARREDRLNALAEVTGAIPVAADISDDADIQKIVDAAAAAGGIDTLINVAGGARGADRIIDAKVEDWEWMYKVNVLGTLKLTKAVLPSLRERGEGTILNVTSTAGQQAYEGGAGYNAAKFGEHAFNDALRLEEAENNIRVIEVAPGLVHTEEFALRRLGSQEAAAKVYAGVEKPLLAKDVADVIAYAVGLPHHVVLSEITVRPVAQPAVHKLLRG